MLPIRLLTTALISIDDAPIKLHPLRRGAVFISPTDLAQLSTTHYRAESVRAMLMAYACSATAVATSRETARMSVTEGKTRPAASSSCPIRLT